MNEIHLHNKRKTITDFFFQLSLIDPVSSPLTSLSSGSGLQEGDIPFTILKGIEKTFIGKKENVDIYKCICAPYTFPTLGQDVFSP
jgi:hypothetical protein